MRKLIFFFIALVIVGIACYAFYFNANGHSPTPYMFESSNFHGALHRAVPDRKRGSANAMIFVWLKSLPKSINLINDDLDVESLEIFRPPKIDQASEYQWVMLIEATVQPGRELISVNFDGESSYDLYQCPRMLFLGSTGIEQTDLTYSNKWWLVNWEKFRQMKPSSDAVEEVAITKSEVNAWPARLPPGYDGYLLVKENDGNWAMVLGRF
jgi:hypothetical protein